MAYFKSVSLLIVFALTACLRAQEPQIIIDAPNLYQSPKSFRSTSLYNSDDISTGVSQEGLAELNMSGSGQFSQQELDYLKKLLPQLAVVVDLRQESHGFVNDDAVSWFVPKNWVKVGLSDSEVNTIQKNLLKELATQKSVPTFILKSSKDQGSGKLDYWNTITPQSVQGEPEILVPHNITYHRFYVTDDQYPALSEIDRSVQLWDSVGENQHVHLHCENGHGRTTTFMVMADILTNAKNVSLDDIIKRQKEIGGENLKKLPDPDDYKYPYEVKRLELIEAFYNYAKTTSSPRPQFSLWAQR
jgi:hypothetical protein